jgi:hypothetical protein
MILNHLPKISEAMQYHLDHDISIAENIFRYGSEAWIELIQEARGLYEDGFIAELDEDEFYLLEGNVGVEVIFEGNTVHLDVPDHDMENPGFFIVHTDDPIQGIVKIKFEGELK